MNFLQSNTDDTLALKLDSDRDVGHNVSGKGQDHKVNKNSTTKISRRKTEVMLSETQRSRLYSLEPMDRYYLWCYTNKNPVLDALSEYDGSGLGLLQPDRILKCFQEVLDPPASIEDIEKTLTSFGTEDTCGLKAVVDYSAYISEMRAKGVRVYNSSHKSHALHKLQKVNLPSDLVQGKPVSIAKIDKLKSDTTAALSLVNKDREHLEYLSTKELLQDIHYETLKSPQARQSVERVLSTYRFVGTCIYLYDYLLSMRYACCHC